MANAKHLPRFLLSLVIWVLIAALAGTLLLTAVYLLPTDAMAQHMESSARTILREGVSPKLFPWCTSMLDNYTDAIILMNAAYDSGTPACQQAMTAARPHIEGLSTPVDVLEAHYGQGVPYDAEEPYYQYWHGYLLLVKPLLLLTDYNGIRILNAIAQTILLAYLIVLMVKKGLKRYILPYLISIAFLMPMALTLSMQFSSCYYILTIGSIAVLLFKDGLNEKDAYIFLFIGIATAYFDFLTYPIATLGIPAVFYYCVQNRMTVRESFSKGLRICFPWGFGYAAMWASKWIIGSIVTGQNILTVASAKLAERSSLNIGQDEGLILSLRIALFQNIKFFLRTPVTLLFAVVSVTGMIFLLLARKRQKNGIQDVLSALFPFAVLACMPLVWYAATTNHSSIHYWFTNKALVVSVFAVMCALIQFGGPIKKAK